MADLPNPVNLEEKEKPRRTIVKQIMDTADWAILGVVAVATAGYLYWRNGAAKAESNYAAYAGAKTTSNTAKSETPAVGKTGKNSMISTLKEIANPNKMILFYGSQTGTAEDLATRLATEVNTHLGVHTLIADLEEYDMSELTRLPSADELPENSKWMVGFFLATYGEGEPTDNATEFYDWLLDGAGKGDDDNVDLEDDMATEQAGKNVNFLIFGLGNKTYEHFNAMSRRVDRRLRSIGANRVGPNGEGDDDGSMEDDFLAWKPKIMEALAEHFGISDGGSKANRDAAHIPLFNWTPVGSDVAQFHGELSADGRPRKFKPADDGVSNYLEVSNKKRILYDVKNPYFSKIVESRHLFANSMDEFAIPAGAETPASYDYQVSADKKKVVIERKCVHMELNLAGSGLRYEAGDHVGVYATNDLRDVNGLARALGIEDRMEEVGKLVPNPANPLAATAKKPIPTPCSLRTALTHYLAITAPIRQHQLTILAKYAQSQEERDQLFELVDDRDLYVAVVEDSQKNLRDILEAFPSIQVPLSVVFGELLHHVIVRYYSISSSPKKDASVVSLTAVVVRYVLPSIDAKPRIVGNLHAKKIMAYRQGLATSCIERLHEQRVSNTPVEEHEALPPLHLPIFIRTSSFRLPRDISAPVIMVGPGTGVAPFRGFIQERMHVASQRKPLAEGASPSAATKTIGSTWLFYGCRNPEQDHLYREEFEEAAGKVAAWRAEGGESDPRAFDLRFINAYSRTGGPKVYVQHKLAGMSEDVWAFLSQKRGYLYVCGDAKNMAADVHQALLKMAMEKGGKSEEKAKAWLKELRGSGRYQEDVW